jgi:hypothetical protein
MGRVNPVIVTVAEMTDVAGYLALAVQVEHWFGPMLGDPVFHPVLDKNIRRGTALCVRRAGRNRPARRHPVHGAKG